MLIHRLLLLICLALSPFAAKADSTVVFNEIMYHPDGDETRLEWVEFFNQNAVDIDLSGWSISGIDYVFPEGTILSGGKYLVIANSPAALQELTGHANALGPYPGRLSNDGERLELINKNKRAVDWVSYKTSGDWPVAPDGGGVSLAKTNPHATSREATNWRSSAQINGTPGSNNFPALGQPANLVFNEISASSAAPSWLEVLNRGSEPMDLSNYAIQSVGRVDAVYQFPTNTLLDAGALLLLDQLQLAFRPKEGDRLFLYSPGKMLLLDAVIVESRPRARRNGEDWFTPNPATPGEVNLFRFNNEVVINEIMYHPPDQEPSDAIYKETVLLLMDAPWKYEQSGNIPPAQWIQPVFDDSAWKTGKALLYYESAALPGPKSTELTLGPMTFYFRTTFQLDSAPQNVELTLNHIIDDGAIVYLNGREILRFNLAEGPIGPSDPASTGVGDAVLISGVVVPAEFLQSGENTLAVEVHQGSAGSSDVVLGLELRARVMVSPPRDFADSEECWIELYNRGTNVVDLSGWSLAKGIDYIFPIGTVMAPGEFLIVAQNAAVISTHHPAARILGNYTGRLSHNSDDVVLLDNLGNPVDETRYFDGAPWPWEADGAGASLELRDARSDNAVPESWSASDEGARSEWKTYSYEGIAANDFGPTLWREFILGLLDAGEVLIDDLSVLEDPDGARREILQNGAFNNGAASWRFLGTHRQSEVIADPGNAANQVLRLVATGSTEHMHNHIETTLLNNLPIANGRKYRISYRAKWVRGCARLNTRLYFNRVAKTTLLDRPEHGGTPGRENSVAIPNAGPTFRELRHSPVVPTATQAVTVTAVATDPDEIGSATLWYAQNGLNWTSVPMTMGAGGELSGTIPPKTTAAIVQFYIEAEDGRGAKSFYPANGAGSRALYKVNDLQSRLGKLHNMRVIMLLSDASALHASTNVMSNAYMPCTILYDEQEVFYNAGVHLQGSQRGRLDSGRAGFTLKFPADHLFRGVHDSVSIDRSGGYSGRGGKQDEIIIRHVANQAAGGLPDMYNDIVYVVAPQSSYNSTGMLLMSKYDGEYLDTAYENGGAGNLFKLELIYYPTTTLGGNPQNPKIPQPDEVTGVDIQNLGSERELYRWFYISENHQERDDYRGVMNLTSTFSKTGAALHEALPQVIDISQWARVFALKSLSGDADTYGYGYPHNHMFYVHPSGKIYTMPWDMDFSWARGATDSILVGARIGEILNSTFENRRLFRGHLLDILNKSYNTNYMARWTAHYGSMASQNYAGILSYINQRATSARSQLPAQVPFAITSNNGQSFSTNSAIAQLQGQAWIDVKVIALNNTNAIVPVQWTSLNTWQIAVPLESGPNSINVIALGFDGQPLQMRPITITSTIPPRDTDGDGMPDWWEDLYLLDINRQDAAEDSDGDGMTNLQEYRAGSDPVNPASNLRLQVNLTASGSITLTFTAKAGKSYRLDYKEAADMEWKALSSFPPVSEEVINQFNQGLSASARWYRLVVL